MNIEFTKEQFLTLLKIVYLGNWMANAQREDGLIEEYESMESFIFSQAKKFGYDKYLDDELKDENLYFPTRAFEEETRVHELVEEYDEDSFWDELVERLSERDTDHAENTGALKNTNISREEVLRLFIEQYDSEFIAHGLERLCLHDKD
jgi:hypothetical protein